MGQTISALWDALGWAILHSLWQGALIGLGVWLLRALLTERRARLRYLVGMGGLVGTCAAFLTTFAILFISRSGSPVRLDPGLAGSPDVAGPITDIGTAITVLTAQTLQAEATIAYVPILGMIWALGFVFLSVQACRAWSHTRWLALNGLRAPSADWSHRFDALIQRCGAPQRIRLFISEHVSGPMTLGALRPIVLVPVGFLTALPPAQVEAILLHELAHIRRHDFLFGLIQTAIRTVLYFNPAVWLMSRAVDSDREQACDDIAVRITGQPADLARGLAALRLASQAPDLAMAADGGPLLTRLNRLMGRRTPRPALRHMTNRLSAAALSALMLGTAACTSVSMANPQTAESAPQLPDTVVRSAKAEPAPKPPKAPRRLAQASPDDAPIPPMPVMPAVPPVPPAPVAPAMPPVPNVPAPVFGDYDSEESFEAAMEAWGDKMEAWGEEVEARFEGEWEAEMEAWGEEVEARFEGEWEDQMEAWGEEMEAWAEELEARGIDPSAYMHGENLAALSSLEALGSLEALARIGDMEVMAEAQAERIAEQVERQVELALRQQERVERQAEREVRMAEREAERAQREAERAMREVERMAERRSHSSKTQTTEISVDGDHSSVEIHGRTVNVNALRQNLAGALVSDGLIRNERSKIKLSLCEDGMEINGKEIGRAQQARYLEIIAASGLRVEGSLLMTLKPDATYIKMSRDGDDDVTMTLGTYKHDTK
ncbi:MAG: M56 family metallopeptidase [Pseudomonadota bacterium]